MTILRATILALALNLVAAADYNTEADNCYAVYTSSVKPGESECVPLRAFSKCLGLAAAATNATSPEVAIKLEQLMFEDMVAASGCKIEDGQNDQPSISSNDGFLRVVVHEDKDIVMARHRRAETISVFRMNDRLNALEERLNNDMDAAIADAKKSSDGATMALASLFDTKLSEDKIARESLRKSLQDSFHASILRVDSTIGSAKSEMAGKVQEVTNMKNSINSQIQQNRNEMNQLTKNVNQQLAQVTPQLNQLKAEVQASKGVIITDANAGACNSANRGRMRYLRSADAIEYCNKENKWVKVSMDPKGSIGNPASDCYSLRNDKAGIYYLRVGSRTFRAYCTGGWALAAVVRTGNCLDHYNRGARRWSDTSNAIQTSAGSTTKWDDSLMNSYRRASTYKGSHGWRMWASNGCMGGDLFCHSDCTFNAQASIGRSRCSYCAQSDGGGFQQGHPNTGTRGMGHHHWKRDFYAWVRHPEQNCHNRGFRSDSCGSSDGRMWIR
eukprot:UC1_evm1s1055